MRVAEIMTANPVCCPSDANLKDVAALMAQHDCGEIPVVNTGSNTPVGVITDRDITCRAVATGKDTSKQSVRDFMSQPVLTVTPDTDLEECLRTMEQNQIRRIPVVDGNGGCCGIISQADIALKTNDHDTAELVQDVSRPTQDSARTR